MRGYHGVVWAFVACAVVGFWALPERAQASVSTDATSGEVGSAHAVELGESSMAGPASRRRSAIDRLLARLNENGLWTNGLFQPIELPENASTQALVARAFPGVRPHILEERRTVIGQDPQPYLIVHVRVPEGERLVVLRYEASMSGWWNRQFQ